MHSNSQNAKLAFHLFLIQHFKSVCCSCYLHSCVTRWAVHEAFLFCVAFQLSFSNYCSKSVCWVSHSCVIPASGIFMPCWGWNSNLYLKTHGFKCPETVVFSACVMFLPSRNCPASQGLGSGLAPDSSWTFVFSLCEYKRETTDVFLVSKF